MATNQISGFIQHLRGVLRDGAAPTDGQLLADYLSRRDEAAVAALVRRHGPMVWGVCSRLLANRQDAEDSFQATFLVLVRKAASIASRELLANWLYGVAHQTALKARATAAKRKGRERPMTETAEPAVREQELGRDLQPLLDEELRRLPDKYRSTIVLCDLEGKTRKEATAQLRCPEGTVAGRLARARVMLAKRLTRRGVALSGGVLEAVLTQQAASAVVPISVTASTIKAASLFAAGKAAAAGAISVKVAGLTEGVLKTMLLNKLKAVMAGVLVLGMLCWGGGLSLHRMAAAQQSPAHEESATNETGQKGKTVDKPKAEETKDDKALLQGPWQVAAVERDGKDQQVEEGSEPLQKRNQWVVKDGWITSTPESQIFFRSAVFAVKPEKNPKEIDLNPYPRGAFLETDVVKGIYTLEGDVWKVCLPHMPLVSEAGERPTAMATKAGAKTVLITLKRLKPDAPAATGVKAAPKPEEEKEAFTAWGKEVGGLQAGLGYLPGEHRTYHIGETVALVVRVRNVSKEAVKFEYLRNFFMEKPPAVTDGEGKPVHLSGLFDTAAAHLPVDVNLPGKEIELYEWTFKLRPASESGKAAFAALYGTGKFHIQYERVFGNSSAGQIKLDPALSKLATGKLELEIKPEAAPQGDKPEKPRVSIDKTKATVEGQLDEASTLVLRIGEEKDKLFWEARRKDTPGSAMVRFSEEGAKRFWGDKAQSAGVFKAVVELSDKILMSDGKFATGFIYSVAICEGAAEKQSLIGSMIYVPIPKDGTLQDLARSLAGDAMPYGQLSLREEGKIARKDGVVTFADVRKGDGKLVPVSFVMEKSHSSLRRKQP